MTRTLAAVVVSLVLASAPAQAHHTHHYRHKVSQRYHKVSHHHHHEPTRAYGSDPRPREWCAWWLRRYLHIPRQLFPNGGYNLARAFLKIGTRARVGCTGCIAVFSRGGGGHVGLVKSWDAHGNPVILSGNFRGRVATYPHPRSRLIGLRWPPSPVALNEQ
jgi:uncharacterized protein (TIGR02594 family)